MSAEQTKTKSNGLLAGLRVLDLSLWQPGHTATQLLADLGADVLKIEPPGGDRMRALPDRFINFNGHKRSLVLDLKTDRDRARLLDLVKTTEVVVEGFRPGVAERLGAGYGPLRAVNPALVYCSISGFGQSGPLSLAPGHDFNYQAYAGAFSPPGPGAPPRPSSALIGDQGSGLAAAFAILAAVLCARRTGEGERIDISIADLLASWVAPMGSIADEAASTDAWANPSPGLGVYATADGGHVVLGIFSEEPLWRLLCRSVGLDQFAEIDHEGRRARADEIGEALKSAFAREDRDSLVARLSELGVPIAPVLSRAQALRHPHFRARGVIARDPSGRRRVAHPIRYENHPARPPGEPPMLNDSASGSG